MYAGEANVSGLAGFCKDRMYYALRGALTKLTIEGAIDNEHVIHYFLL